MSNINDFVIENGVLKKYVGSGGAVVIPDNVTKIGSKVFFCCKSLTSITIPESVTKIGSLAFSCCTSLKQITIPNSVTRIDDCAFRDCNNVEAVAKFLKMSITLEQICNFIRLSNESKATEVTALLLDFKNKNFADFDLMDELTLEL